MKRALGVLIALLPLAAGAQEGGSGLTPLPPDEIITLTPLDPPEPSQPQVKAEEAVTAPGAVIRVLDRVSGKLNDLELDDGQETGFGRIDITLGECRFPKDNPASDAYAFLTIRDAGKEEPVFSGWMIASSPALNALDHPRYDVWVLRCKTP